MWMRLVGGIVACLIGGVWILQGLDIATGSGMSGHAVWAVLGAMLVFVGAMLISAAIKTRRARSFPVDAPQ
jgi:uncharacterized membrane protein HdeD (DUF308 family)